ncbi:MAG: fibronectin type III domain-containing protein [Bacteroidales bacterium]|nr:fibronectin type III domain-containing protein [Bacteroidales bacterium]
MRKVFLTFVASLLCSIVSFAQTQIWTAQGFIDSVEASGNYKLMADINLGTYDATSNNFVIDNFSGTFDGNGHTITYQASYSSGSFGLFQSVSGTIKNLTVSASVTFGGVNNALNVGLLCGSLGSSGVLQSCNVIGVINSTAVSSNDSGTDSGLLVGESSGTIKYCIGNGSVTGLGHVGGLIGRMNGDSSSVLGSAFTGSLYAIAPNKANQGGSPHSYGSIAGGICGAVQDGSSIKSCFVKADIVAEDANKNKVPCLPYGIAYDHNNVNIDVLNNYCEGTLNGEPIDTHADVTDSDSTNNYSNYYPGYGNMSNQAIVDALNNAAAGDPNIHFGLTDDGDDEEVIFGVVSTDKVCETPTNLTITNTEGAFTASWTSANANNTITESHWHWSLTGGDAYDNGGDASSVSVNLGTLPASSTPYTFMVYTDCSETVNGLTSSAVSQQFYVDCPAPTGLTASNITDNGFTISWTANVDCQLTVNGNTYPISAGNPMTKQITGLNPETPYTAIVKAKCGNAYVKQASINVTTARLAAPTGLAVTTSWNGSAGDNGGSATISWTTIEGLTYEVDNENNTQTSPYQISSTLAQGSYTAKVRAKKGDKYSDWASIPYTVSTPNAPSNPIVTYQHTAGEEFNVHISWTPGTEPNGGWRIELNEATIGPNVTTNSFVVTLQNAGSASIVQIIEKVDNSTSEPLKVPIQVPCLPASEPTSIVPALNSVTFNFAVAKTRKIVIGSTEYEANNESVTINGLTEGTSYAYEIREYCNTTTNTYSSISSTFSTLACNPVANLSVSNVGQTSATVSWTSQSGTPNLQYKVVVNGGVPTVQTAKTINLTELSLATTYTVRVSEQCGAVGNWGEERTITFTTQGTKTYISAKTGNFSDGATWIGGQIPSIAPSETASITINAGHTVTLDVTFELRNNITFTNNGVLSIGQKGELINTTNNNVGGIVEIVTPIKAINKWTFIGAPFGNGYKLEAVKPVSGSDIAMVKYNYTSGAWSNSWATINTSMEAAEGTFAWPFYGGAVTFTTYGDVINNAYDYSQSPKYALNNGDVTVTESITASSGGNWMALSNPYPAKLSVSKFLDANTFANSSVGTPSIQGEGVYIFNGTSFDYKKTGDILMTEGFFVNFANPAGNKSVTFTKNQLSYNAQAKSSANEFIELTLQNGNDKVRVYFAHNEDAEQGYDIFDANKMFATTGVAEPYFVTDGIALIKEEVA